MVKDAKAEINTILNQVPSKLFVEKINNSLPEDSDIREILQQKTNETVTDREIHKGWLAIQLNVFDEIETQVDRNIFLGVYADIINHYVNDAYQTALNLLRLREFQNLSAEIQSLSDERLGAYANELQSLFENLEFAPASHQLEDIHNSLESVDFQNMIINEPSEKQVNKLIDIIDECNKYLHSNRKYVGMFADTIKDNDIRNSYVDQSANDILCSWFEPTSIEFVEIFDDEIRNSIGHGGYYSPDQENEVVFKYDKGDETVEKRLSFSDVSGYVFELLGLVHLIQSIFTLTYNVFIQRLMGDEIYKEVSERSEFDI